MKPPFKQNDVTAVSKPIYDAFDATTKRDVIAKYVVDFPHVQHSTGNNRTVATEALTQTINVRSPFNRADYDNWRPNERMPRSFKDVIIACRSAYLRLGVVRNVIDMMTDFATEGMRLLDPDKENEAFFRAWAKKVKLSDAADEFVRHLLIDSNVVIKRTMAKLTKPVQTQWTQADKVYVDPKQTKKEIPIKYDFLNVAALYWLGDESGKATDTKRLAFKLSSQLANNIRTPSDDFQRNLVTKLPLNIKTSVIDNKSDLIPLDMGNLYVSHNKKDSWEDWAPPFLYSILADIDFRDKLKQAELSALDGFINVIRLWKLGDHKEGFLPNQTGVNRLIDILGAHTGGGAIDIVWDSLIDMKDFYPPIDKILGAAKYEQINRDILIGLGIPEVLLGGKGSNFSNSFIQLKTLIEKLGYVRRKLNEWLTEELKIVAAANGTSIPRIRFDTILEDENVVRKLIVQLLDRGIVSVEAVLDIYGEDFLLEVDRIRREKPILKKNNVEVFNPLNPPTTPAQTVKEGGRPVKTNDTTKRDFRNAKPRTASELSIFALDAIDIIDETITDTYMSTFNIANARKLTNEQRQIINDMRITVLACINSNDKIDKDSVTNLLEKLSPNTEILNSINEVKSKFMLNNGDPTLQQLKRIEAMGWVLYQTGVTNA